MDEIKLDQNSLKKLVQHFEEKEYDLTDVPQEQVEQFGYPSLSHSLMYKEQRIPEYDLKIAEYIKTHTFDTIDSLISYISTIKDDINKLFCIFSYEALNFEFDINLYLSGKYKQESFEKIFETKKTVSNGFTYFFIEMAKRVKINNEKITIKEYPNYYKSFDFNPLDPPKNVKQNHSSIYLKIDSIQFISEPTWSAGEVNENDEFVKNFNPNLFLIPLYNSICDHFPINESQNFFPFKFKFSEFFECLKVSPFEKCLKTETYPFIKLITSNGYVAQTYSCKSPIQKVEFKIFKRNDHVFKRISIDGTTSYEVIETKIKNHKERCRFVTYIVFQEEGFYEVEMYIDSLKVLNYFVDVPLKNEGSIPVAFNYFHDSKFIPMSPKTILTKIVDGIALIRFAVAVKKSQILWNIVKMNDQNGFNDEGEIIERKYGRYIKLKIPFDIKRYEDQLCVTFPSNGRYLVEILLYEDDGSFQNYTKYYFDVTGVVSKSPKPINPVCYMFNDREFAPNHIFDKNNREVTIKPNLTCNLVKEKEQTIRIKTASTNDEIHFEFRLEEKTVAWPSEEEGKGEFRRFKWSIPGDYGEYHLMGWINDKHCIDITYIYNNLIFKEKSKEEIEILDDLMNKIRQEDPEMFEIMKNQVNKSEDMNEEEEIIEKKKSKCCLLT